MRPTFGTLEWGKKNNARAGCFPGMSYAKGTVGSANES
jgi:hypothetical protein